MPDLCNQQDACTRTYLYADDAKIYRVINQISDQADLQAVVNTVKNWSDCRICVGIHYKLLT